MAIPVVAIVGAPNVGKSTLFNRLVGRRRSIVTDQPGVTRDRLYGEVRGEPQPFRVVDTGGMTPHVDAPFAREIEAQAGVALDEAKLVLLVVDGRHAASALDREIAALLRRRGVPLVLVANKIDSERSEPGVDELYDLGLGEPIAISAEHGRGMDRLLEVIESHLAVEGSAAEPLAEQPPRPVLNIAIVGRPNVGKSSILNRLVGHERALVSDVPGTTRDAIDTLLEYEGRCYRLIDTAGIRRRGKIDRGVERFSVTRARQNIAGCDVAVLVLDATEELAAQDTHIAGWLQDAGKPWMVVVNKWDLAVGREAAAKQWSERITHRLRFAKDVPMVLISAKTGQRVERILALADGLHANAGIRVTTPQLNDWLQRLLGPVEDRRTPGGARIYYATQTGAHPPRFVLFCNDARRVHFSLKRRIENSLREQFGFGAAPIVLQFRSRERDSR